MWVSFTKWSVIESESNPEMVLIGMVSFMGNSYIGFCY